MTKILLAGTLLLCSFTWAKDGPWFSGKIVYHNTFATLAGEDITAKVAPIFGIDDPYYISDNNYKMYTEQQKLVQLYNGDTNTYQFFMDGQSVPGLDAAVGTPGAVVTPLTQMATVAGYPCKSVQIANDSQGISTVYYYAPKLRVNPERFAKHAFGDFYTYLKATNGGLPLRTIVTNTKQGFVLTSEATSVQAMPLAASEFTTDAVPR